MICFLIDHKDRVCCVLWHTLSTFLLANTRSSFTGMMNRDYETNASQVHPSVINHWTGTGLAMSIAANRVSYFFNFTGPSLCVDSACSSSLVALHMACHSIQQGVFPCQHVCAGAKYYQKKLDAKYSFALLLR